MVALSLVSHLCHRKLQSLNPPSVANFPTPAQPPQIPANTPPLHFKESVQENIFQFL